jgi:hypothetical protein
MANVPVAEPEAESVTRAEKLKLPADVGVPEIDPFAERVIPGGNCPPVSDQLYGGVPPLADRDPE